MKIQVSGKSWCYNNDKIMEWNTIELDLDHLESWGEYETTDSLGWKVKAELKRCKNATI